MTFFDKNDPPKMDANWNSKTPFKKILAVCCEFSFKVWLQILERFANFKAKRAQNIKKN
jgi:hypothetical protein